MAARNVAGWKTFAWLCLFTTLGALLGVCGGGGGLILADMYLGISNDDGPAIDIDCVRAFIDPPLRSRDSN